MHIYTDTHTHTHTHIYIYIYIYKDNTISFQTFFLTVTFIASKQMKLYSLSKESPPAAMHLYRSKIFWKAPSKSSYLSMSMTLSQPLSSPQLSHNNSL